MRQGSVKGLDSYRIEDGGYFFGRDGDSERLTSRILSSRFTLLHARSGAGKTSLLQAKAAPDLERQGWTVVVARPGRHPAGSDPARVVYSAVLKALVPPPAAELAAIQRACKALLPENPTGEPTLNQLMEKYRDRERIAKSQPPSSEEVSKSQDQQDCASKAQPPSSAEVSASRELIRSLQSPVDISSGDTPSEAYYVQFSVVLRGGMPPADYLRHIAALCARPPYAGSPEAAGAVPLTQIIQSLEDSKAGLYDALLSVLDAPFKTLTEFFTRLFAVYGKWRPNLKLALVLDQFEELFTLFGDLSTGVAPNPGLEGLEDVHSYTLRNEFFAQLQELYLRIRERGQDEESAGQTPLPLCCVVSIRQEFIADLDPLRAFVSDLDQWSFHLDRLRAEVAAQVLVKITKDTGWSFTQNLAGRIASGLTCEGRYVDPAELQVVTEQILDKRGSKGDGGADDGPAEAFESLGAESAGPGAERKSLNDRDLVRNILSRFFEKFLDSASRDPDKPDERMRNRVELLEILQPLITDRGKAPAPVYKLTDAPFRDKKRRQKLLDDLEQGRIIRREAQNGIMMAEIRHDFLIKPIQRAVGEELKSEEYGRLISTQAVLISRIELRSDDLVRSLLTRREYDDTSKYQHTLSWDYASAGWRWTPVELMLRSALSFKDAPKNFKDWTRRWRVDTEDASTAAIRAASSGGLSRQGMAVLNQHPDDCSLTPDQILAVIKNHLELCQAHERHLIESWTKRWQRADNERRNV